LDNSNYDDFHGGNAFSHAYVNMHKYFVKKPKMQKKIHKPLYITSCVFLHENILHILSTLGTTNSKPSEYKKSTKWKKKGSFSLLPF
jgi:hypothetical protein